MSEPFLGEIRPFAGNFAPKNWALCNGQLLPIVQYTALFSILGTTYGGDGKTTFGLPNLQGSAPMGMGDGPGLTPRSEGEVLGSSSVTLTNAELPAHNHAFFGSGDISTSNTPGGNVTASTSTALAIYDTAASGTTALAPQAIMPSGGSQPHNNMQPYLAVTYIIALQGIFPSRG